MKRLIILIILFSNFAHADQKDYRLIELFDKLFLSTNNVEASKLLFNIWDIWSIADNQETQILFDEANQFMDVGELDNAIELFSKVVEQSPEFAEGWNKRATVYFLKGELNKSIQIEARKIRYDWFKKILIEYNYDLITTCLLYTSPSPRDGLLSRMPSSA